MSKKVFNKAIIYDDNCPLCNAYTSAFVKGGFLQKKNRISFSEVNIKQFAIDWEKAKHEIPLIDLNTGEVKYGIDALADILQQKIFFIKPVLRLKLVNWFFRKLYQLISYNRNIIVASTPEQHQNFNATPNYSFFWRWILIAICGIINCILLQYLMLFFVPTFSVTIVYFIGATLFTLMASISVVANKKIITEVVAHVFISSLIALFVAVVPLIFKKYFNLSAGFIFVFFANSCVLFLYQLVKRYQFVCKSNHC